MTTNGFHVFLLLGYAQNVSLPIGIGKARIKTKKELKMNRIAVFIGRFQPFHNGHKYLIDYIVTEYDKVIIIIGSCNKSGYPHNPFTFPERKSMLEGYYGENENITILPLRDDPDDLQWERMAINLIDKNVDNGDDVTITGFMKTDCFYLNMFPSFKKQIFPGGFFNPEQGDILSGTFIRNEFFKSGRINYAVVPLKVKEFLFRFQKSEIYKKIKEDY